MAKYLAAGADRPLQLQEFLLQPQRAVLGQVLSVSDYSRGANCSLYCRFLLLSPEQVYRNVMFNWKGIAGHSGFSAVSAIAKQNIICAVC